MKVKRLIARLDVKNESLVKGIHLEGLRVLGCPEWYAQQYYQDGIDELLFMDVVASLYGRNSLTDLVRKTAKDIFVPLTVGGGIRNADDVRLLLNSGADKVAINTAAIKTPDLVRELAQQFGSSTIAVSIEVIKDRTGRYFAYVDNGREPTGIDAIQWARQVEELGAGEIIVTSVDNEGTGRGLDLELIRLVHDAVSISVVAHGGVGQVSDIVAAFKLTNVEGVCAASLFHYEAVHRVDMDSSGLRGNTSFIKSGKTKKNIDPISVSNAKNILHQSDIDVRKIR